MTSAHMQILSSTVTYSSAPPDYGVFLRFVEFPIAIFLSQPTPIHRDDFGDVLRNSIEMVWEALDSSA